MLVGCLLGLLFSPEDGVDILLRNVGILRTGYTALYSISQQTEQFLVYIILVHSAENARSKTTGSIRVFTALFQLVQNMY
jgi:hypothetical protein